MICFTCTLDHSLIGAISSRRFLPRGVKAYSTRGGTSEHIQCVAPVHHAPDDAGSVSAFFPYPPMEANQTHRLSSKESNNEQGPRINKHSENMPRRTVRIIPISQRRKQCSHSTPSLFQHPTLSVASLQTAHSVPFRRPLSFLVRMPPLSAIL